MFVGFSRDGFHWYRPVVEGRHQPFLRMDRTIVRKPSDWKWNKAMVQSVGGGFTVSAASGAPMRFYASGRTGIDQIIGFPEPSGTGIASTGVAELRRDGFAAVGAAGSGAAVLVTRPIVFDREKAWLFVNAEHADEMVMSVLDAADGRCLPGLAEADYRGTGKTTSGDRLAVSWATGADALRVVAGRAVRLSVRFTSGRARLFAFWVSVDGCGASGGWVAAGGVGFNASRDLRGSC